MKRFIILILLSTLIATVSVGIAGQKSKNTVAAEKQISVVESPLSQGNEIKDVCDHPSVGSTPDLARRGCCSHHGGVCGCDEASDRIRCCDGTLSPSCTCSGY
jgi:hypothetical protein